MFFGGRGSPYEAVTETLEQSGSAADEETEKKKDDKRSGKIDKIAVDFRVRSKQPIAVMC